MNDVVVVARPGEGIESLLSRFKRQVIKSRRLKECLQKQHYLKPSLLKRKKRLARRKIIKRFGPRGLKRYLKRKPNEAKQKALPISEPSRGDLHKGSQPNDYR